MAREPIANYRLGKHIDESGWTQSRVAELINDLVAVRTGRCGSYTDESIRKLLRGHHTWPRKPYRDALCALFDSTPTDLGFYESRSIRRANPANTDELAVDRHEFLRSVAALPVAAALPRTERDAAVQPFGPSTPAGVGMEHVEQVRAWAALFRQADDAGLAMIEGMTAQLRVAASYLHARMPPHVDTAMKEAVATFYRVVGWAHYDRGDHAQACADFDHGWQLVADDGEWWLRSAILTCMARQSVYRGHTDDALDKLGIASIRNDKISMLRRADIAAVKARAFGRQGNHRECLRAVTEAEQYITEAHNEDHPDTRHESFHLYYTDTLLGSDVAHGLFELAFTQGLEVDHTIDRLRTARQLSDQHARSRLLSTAHLAALQLRRGDIDEGIALATEVIDNATGTTSRRIVHDISRIHRLTAATKIKKNARVPELRQKSHHFLRNV